MPEMRDVYSSHVAKIGYEDGELHVVYNRGKSAGTTVIYSGVTPEVAAQVLSAPSIGSALHALVRVPRGAEPRYPHRYADERTE